MSDEPDYQHRCEVRMLLVKRAKQGRDAVESYLGASAVRGRAQQLNRDVRAQWVLGNRGKWGDWREKDKETK